MVRLPPFFLVLTVHHLLNIRSSSNALSSLGLRWATSYLSVRFIYLLLAPYMLLFSFSTKLRSFNGWAIAEPSFCLTTSLPHDLYRKPAAGRCTSYIKWEVNVRSAMASIFVQFCNRPWNIFFISRLFIMRSLVGQLPEDLRLQWLDHLWFLNWKAWQTSIENLHTSLILLTNSSVLYVSGTTRKIWKTGLLQGNNLRRLFYSVSLDC